MSWEFDQVFSPKSLQTNKEVLISKNTTKKKEVYTKVKQLHSLRYLSEHFVYQSLIKYILIIYKNAKKSFYF